MTRFRDDYRRSMNWIFDLLIQLRTTSKDSGTSNLRIGYLIYWYNSALQVMRAALLISELDIWFIDTTQNYK
jgi:hypothetical protein